MTGTQFSTRAKQVGAILCLAIPALVFYIILCRTAVNLPILDDYQIILGTTNLLHETHGVASHAAIILTSEHNGYKLIFENSVVWLFYSLIGRIYILPLVAIGNGLALVIFLAVALMARDNADDHLSWLVMLIPAAFLIFQLQYASALNFASSSLQHLAVIAFSLLAIYLTTRSSSGAFIFSCAGSVLAIASSPNGFFLAPVGLLILIQQKQWKRIGYWMGLFILMLVLYLFRYTSTTTPQGTIVEAGPALHNINIVYALSFLGSSVARYSSVLPSIVLGLLFCAIIALAAARRYFFQNPAVFYSMVFILLNAIAVSSLRSDSGVAQSLASRYRTYSNLMLVFSYFFLAENIARLWKNRNARRGAFLAVTVLSAAFCTVSDRAGTRFLGEKKFALIESYQAEWQNGLTAEHLPNEAIETNSILRRQIEAGIYRVNLPIMRESVRLGVYIPPRKP
jgi:hypothetical protein